MAEGSSGVGVFGTPACRFGVSCRQKNPMGFFMGSDVVAGGDAISGEFVLSINAMGSSSDAACDSWVVE